MRLWIGLFAALGLASAALGAAPPLDTKRYMPLSQVEVGMTGVGKTTLEGTEIVEFQFKVLAIQRNVAPRRDRILIRCSGANLEQSGVVAGMSGSPVYLNGRLIGAVAYAFPWCKVPIAGVQPIEQMLEVTDEKAWSPPERRVADAAGPAPQRRPAVDPGLVAALGVADPSAALPGGEAFQMQPIQTPVMVSGLSPRVLARFREHLAPLGLVPMEGGGADAGRPPAARFEPGAPLAVTLLRGDLRATAMGTITDIVGDRLYAFGHAMFGLGEADYPLMSGVAHVVIPSLMNSVRLGAPVEEMGRLVWDEQTGIFGRISKERAAMVPIAVKVTGPTPGMVRSYRYEVVRHRSLTSMLSATAVAGSLTVLSDLPYEHTVAYRVAIKPVGRPAVVRENLVVSPDGDAYVESQVRMAVVLLTENPYQALAVESIEVEATVEPSSRLAEIQEARALRNAVRPGGTVPVEIKIRPWRGEPRWMRVEVPVPADYPDGTYRLSLCGADDALRQEMREAPARFRPDDVESLLAILGRNERRDQLFVRLEAPGDGVAIGRDELPNLPPSMRSILSESARRQVSSVAVPRITRQAMPFVLQGSGDVTVTVNRNAPEP